MTNADPRRCRLCQSVMPHGAIKCLKCGGFQGRWFFLNLGAPTIGLLVALVSVVSLSVALLSPMLTRRYSELTASFGLFDDGKAHFFVSNSGNMPAAVGEAWLDYVGPPKNSRFYLIEKSGNKFVSPASSRDLVFEIPCHEPRPGIEYSFDEGFGAHPISKNEIVIALVQFNGRVEYKKFPIDKLPGLGAINDAGHKCLEADIASDESEANAISSGGLSGQGPQAKLLKSLQEQSRRPNANPQPYPSTPTPRVGAP